MGWEVIIFCHLSGGEGGKKKYLVRYLDSISSGGGGGGVVKRLVIQMKMYPSPMYPTPHSLLPTC